jgi:hypothetical protein
LIELQQDPAQIMERENKAIAISFLNGLIEEEQRRYDKEIRLGVTQKID